VEFATAEFLVPMISTSRVSGVGVLTLSIWFILLAYLATVAAMAWRAIQRIRSKGAPLEGSPTGG
jgi:hypothetical protein